MGACDVTFALMILYRGTVGGPKNGADNHITAKVHDVVNAGTAKGREGGRNLFTQLCVRGTTMLTTCKMLCSSTF